jgi:membrane protein
LVTAISTMTTVEYAFNAIFRAPRGRSYLRRLSDYLGVVVVVPALIAGAVTLSTLVTFRFWEAQFAARLVPYALAWAAFFFLFVFFPYTRVRVVPALIGSFVTAVLFQLAQWGYVYFQIGVTSYQAIYGALASVPIFLVWVYVAWAIVLFGAELTAAIQRGVPQRALHRGESAGFARAAALQVLLRLAERQDGVDRERRITVETLADDLGVEPRALAPVVERLLASGALASGADDALALAAPAESLSVADAMRGLLDAEAGDARDARVEELLERVGRAEREVLRGVTIADLAGSKSRPARDDAED